MYSGKIRIAVLISGNGSNLQALIDAAKAPDFPGEIVLVISNKEDAYGLTRARDAGIATEVIDHTQFPARDDFDGELHVALLSHQIEFVCLAGFMRVLTGTFVAEWHGAMINIHPSLLPNHKGMRTHERAIKAGDKQHGCSVHWVTPGVDEGDVIAQSALDILPGDTAESLKERVHELEYQLYPKTLREVLVNFV